jgi:hypothetical protein
MSRQGRAVLEAAFGAEALAPAVQAGVRAALGQGAPESSPDAAAADVVDRLAEWHEVELAAGERDVSERLAARFSPEILHHPHVLSAIDDVLDADRGAHAVARVVAGRDLAGAFAAPSGERQGRVEGVLEAERGRVRDRGQTRVARAVRQVLASVRLPDEALDTPAGGWRREAR